MSGTPDTTGSMDGGSLWTDAPYHGGVAGSDSDPQTGSDTASPAPFEVYVVDSHDERLCIRYTGQEALNLIEQLPTHLRDTVRKALEDAGFIPVARDGECGTSPITSGCTVPGASGPTLNVRSALTKTDGLFFSFGGQKIAVQGLFNGTLKKDDCGDLPPENTVRIRSLSLEATAETDWIGQIQEERTAVGNRVRIVLQANSGSFDVKGPNGETLATVNANEAVIIYEDPDTGGYTVYDMCVKEDGKVVCESDKTEPRDAGTGEYLFPIDQEVVDSLAATSSALVAEPEAPAESPWGSCAIGDLNRNGIDVSFVITGGIVVGIAFVTRKLIMVRTATQNLLVPTESLQTYVEGGQDKAQILPSVPSRPPAKSPKDAIFHGTQGFPPQTDMSGPHKKKR